MAATVIISLVIAGIVGLIIFNMVRDRKAGRCSCGGNCADCGMCHHNRK